MWFGNEAMICISCMYVNTHARQRGERGAKALANITLSHTLSLTHTHAHTPAHTRTHTHTQEFVYRHPESFEEPGAAAEIVQLRWRHYERKRREKLHWAIEV